MLSATRVGFHRKWVMYGNLIRFDSILIQLWNGNCWIDPYISLAHAIVKCKLIRFVEVWCPRNTSICHMLIDWLYLLKGFYHNSQIACNVWILYWPKWFVASTESISCHLTHTWLDFHSRSEIPFLLNLAIWCCKSNVRVLVDRCVRPVIGRTQ